MCAMGMAGMPVIHYRISSSPTSRYQEIADSIIYWRFPTCVTFLKIKIPGTIDDPVWLLENDTNHEPTKPTSQPAKQPPNSWKHEAVEVLEVNVSLYHTVITCSNAGCIVTKNPPEEFYCGEQTLGGAKGRQDQSLACQVCPKSMMGQSGDYRQGNHYIGHMWREFCNPSPIYDEISATSTDRSELRSQRVFVRESRCCKCHPQMVGLLSNKLPSCVWWRLSYIWTASSVSRYVTKCV